MHWTSAEMAADNMEISRVWVSGGCILGVRTEGGILLIIGKQVPCYDMQTLVMDGHGLAVLCDE